MRILHLSDIHVEIPPWQVRIKDLLGRRWAGYANLHLGRRCSHFAGAAGRLERLVGHLCALQPDFGVLSGDITALGLEQEFLRARAILAPLLGDGRRWLVIPGNHDLFTVPSARRHFFERAFGELIHPDLSSAGRASPTAHLAGDHLALVALNTCRPNRLFWDSRGFVEPAELAALEQLLGRAELAQREIWLVSHYGPFRADGRPDAGLHGISNLGELLAFLRRHRIALWLHGHLHRSYALVGGEVAPPTANSGSATHRLRASFHLYESLEAGWRVRSMSACEEGVSENWSKTFGT